MRREVNRGIFLGRGVCAGGKCEHNIEVGLKGIEWEGVGWIHLAEDWDTWRAVANAVMNLRVSQKRGEFLDILNKWRLLEKQLCCVELIMIISGYGR
jgi:hypothetical protein